MSFFLHVVKNGRWKIKEGREEGREGKERTEGFWREMKLREKYEARKMV